MTETETIITPNTVAEKVVIAAFDLEEQGESPFSAEALIVTAWGRYPDTFGLRYYESTHPDSNKVLASIMGRRGLTNRGWFVKVDQKKYELTREGRQVARRILKPGEACEEEPATRELTEDQDHLLQRLLGSSAADKVQQDPALPLTFADACRFWNITDSLQTEDLDNRLQQVETQLGEIDRVLGTAAARLRDGRTVLPDDVSFLGDLNSALVQRFNRHLNLLRHRTGKG